MLWLADLLESQPPTGEPSARDWPARFGGRGDLIRRPYPYRRWLEALTGHLLADIKPHLRQNEDCWGIGRRVRILDATDIQEPGSTGSDWRIHYSLRLPEMCCDFFELTDYHGAESLRRLPVE